ncbi:hypothetical protein CLV31_11598 [Algoriphagus aquaeductus]|uniref:Glycosyl transferase family 1 n=1 Tax=Algoriphagus aquaeductus TaxID=475299 RepID=A0A326RU56_9BACT|nr:hypothetical protein [Algoriphagus aquaeductus]PZV79138.1 hypothetical protein CLV31_11598 [Algoriphagus aquaeductus]
MEIEIPVWTTHHNQFLYSFSTYAEKMKIKLYIRLNTDIHLNGAILYYNQKVIFFDYSDDRSLIDSPLAYDAYFKRSLDPIDSKKFGNIFPLNFHINIAGNPFRLMSQMDPAIFFKKGSLVEFLRASDTFGWFANEYHGSIHINRFKRKNDSGGRVIFMTRLWDPARNDDPAEKERRRIQNEFRTNACRIIKKHFPDSVVGLFPDEFAIRTSNDVLLDIRATKKKDYLKILSECDIGVADDGLKDTPGWKIGEYALCGKAIVSTPITIHMEDFREDVNFLSTNHRENYSIIPDLISVLKKNNFYKEIQQNNRDWSSRFLDPFCYVEHILSNI